MSRRSELEALKTLFEENLITESVYLEKQREILARSAEVETATVSPPTASEIDQPKKKSSFKWLELLAFLLLPLLLISILILRSNDQEAKDKLLAYASNVGATSLLLSWQDRAGPAAEKLILRNDAQIAKALLSLTHPSGTNPSITISNTAKLNDRIVLDIELLWDGGFLGLKHKTVLSWEISPSDHIVAKVHLDSTGLTPSVQDRESLNDYFRTKIYPALLRSI